MSIREHIGQDGKLYFRVRRNWDNQEYQNYISAEKNKAAALRKAEKLDQKWSKDQETFYKKKQLPKNSLFAKDNRIVGLNLQVIKRKHYRPVDEFNLRIKNPETQKIHHTSVSINEHGFDHAFKIAIEKICMFRSIGPRTKLKRQMLETKQLYKDLLETINPDRI